MIRQTLATAFTRQGIGVHTGNPCTALVAPAEFGTGFVFQTPSGRQVQARLAHVAPMAGMTVLKHGRVALGMVEHLLAALYARGITDARITVFGPEVPVLDGSALPWTSGLDEAGTKRGPETEPLVVTEVVRVEDGASWAELRPADQCEVAVTVDFGPTLRGGAEVVLGQQAFATDVAWARTFALQRDIARLRQQGRGAGASLENTVVLRPDGSALNPGGLRQPDECVRHKLLDAIGDLALIGAPLQGRMVVHRGSHALHQQLLVKAFGKWGPEGDVLPA